MKKIILFSCLAVLSFINSSTVLAETNINGKYNSTVFFSKKTVLNGGSCLANPEDRRDYQIKKVRLNNTTQKVTAKLYFAGYDTPYNLSGQKTDKGFTLRLNYSDYYFTYSYKYIFTQIKEGSAKLKETGNTYYNGTTTGCRYTYSGSATR